MQRQNSSNKDVMRYAGLGAQIVVSVGAAVVAGYYLDKWLKFSFPLFIIVLPLAMVCSMMYKLIKETSKKKENDPAK